MSSCGSRSSAKYIVDGEGGRCACVVHPVADSGQLYEVDLVANVNTVETAFSSTAGAATKRGRHPLVGNLSPPTAATPPSLKRPRHDHAVESSAAATAAGSPVIAAAAASPTTELDIMEAPLTLSQSMDSVNTATGEEEVSAEDNPIIASPIMSSEGVRAIDYVGGNY